MKITGLKVARGIGLLALAALVVSAVVSWVQNGTPVPAFLSENPYIGAAFVACIIPFILKENEKKED